MTEPDIDELEAQEWPEAHDLEGRITHEFIDGTEIEFKVQDPEIETVLRFISPTPSGETSSAEFFAFVSEAVIAPQITLERWREWATADKILLSEKLSNKTGLDQVLGTISDEVLSAAAEDVVEGEEEKSGDDDRHVDDRQDGQQKVGE
jgi:hypothetical protein